MNKFRQKIDGFGVIEIVLTVVVVGIIATLGWIAYNNYFSKDSASIVNTQEQTNDTTNKDSETPEDPTADWVAYNSEDKKISFKYPKGWVMPGNIDSCQSSVLLAPSAESSGRCQSGTLGQVQIAWEASDQSCNDDDKNTFNNGQGEIVLWTDNTKEEVTVSGVKGVKRTRISTGQSAFGDPPGTFRIEYCFNTGGYKYQAIYRQTSSYPDVQSDFNKIVTKTLKFGSR